VTSTQELFKQPSAEARIWRYLDFARLLSMLEAGGLFLPRAHLLGDPFEGSFPLKNLELRRKLYQSIAEANPKVDVATAMAKMSTYFEWDRYWILVSCWHVNEHESAAMWDLYARGESTVAVQSTFARLRAALPEDVRIGLVEYLDYDSDTLPEGNVFAPFLRKRRSFQHEHELRAIWWDTSSIGKDPPDEGKFFPCDLSALIERVYVSPIAPQWIRHLVPRVLARYQLSTVPIVQSRLSDRPVF
jgi:hypothetical protein